jgi:hypothetical protein
LHKDTQLATAFAVRQLQLGSEYRHVKERNSTLGSNLEPLVNVWGEFDVILTVHRR